jgi:serine/threonine protein kinase
MCKISGFETPPLPGQRSTSDGTTVTRLKIFYTAPEVISPKQVYNSKIDIWSVGCVLIEMWTGKRVWDGEGMLPIMMKV